MAVALPNQLVVDVNGVGYQVSIPLGTFDQLNPIVGDEVYLLTYMHVRETAHTLYGFATEAERDLFLLLIDRVSGIGPSLALAALSGMSVEQFKGAVVAGDVASLSKVKGLGKKTAERIVLELKDKVGVTDTWEAQAQGGGPSPVQDAELALIALGYKQAEARKAVLKARDMGGVETESSDELIKRALRLLNQIG